MSTASPLARATSSLSLLPTHIPKPWQNPLPKLQPVEKSIEEASNPSLQSLLDSITTLSTQGHLPAAFSAFSILLHLHPSLHFPPPISSLLYLSTHLKALPQGKQLHSLSLSLGLLPHPPLLARLASFYSSFGDLSSAFSVALESPQTPPWNIAISSYIRDGFSKNAIKTYREMLLRGVAPDSFTYPSVLKACADAKDLNLGREIHGCIRSSGIGWNLFVANALVAMYAKCGELGVARKLFDEMPERDIVSWNSMVSGYASKGMWGEAFVLFEWMRREEAVVNSVTWNTIVSGHLKLGNHGQGLELISEMRWSGFNMDFVTLVIGLNACSRIGVLRPGKEIHGLTVRTHFDAVESVNNALITMYSRCRDMSHAHVLFEKAKHRSLVTWNTMIAGYALGDQAEEASMVFRDLTWSGLQPNYVTVVTILSLCARVANLQHGRELHCYIIKQGFKDYRLLWNSLVDMYSKSGRVSEARRVFDTMIDCDEVSYTSMIAGYGMQGEGKTAVKFFDEMISSGISPDSITIVAVLSACSHSGLVSDGELIFNNMRELYGIEPKMEHFSCMVDLYARAGHLQKAEEMLNRMPFRPRPAIWAALVGACLVRGNTEIGERAAERLLEMRTENAGHYVLIANMYAAAGQWKELATVRKKMRDMGVRKAPGCAWADLGNGFHPFLVGDRSSPLTLEIYETLEGLSEQMRDAGYVSSAGQEFDEEVDGVES